MNIADLVNSVITIPSVRGLMLPVEKGGLGISRAELEADLQQRSGDAITEVVTAFPWDFAIKETTFDTVIDQESYTLTGINDDALSIFYLKNTATTSSKVKDTEIISKTINSMNEIKSDNSDIEDGKYWEPDGRDGLFPKIKITDPPSTVYSITYQYWRNDINISELSADFDPLLIECLAKRFTSSTEYENQLTKVIRNYDRPNAKVDIAQLDPQVKLNYMRQRMINGW